MATSENGALLAMSGPRNPYPEGPVGRIERGAYADILVVDAKEIPSLASFLTPETSLRLIMKDGRIFKNSL
jgi:imidazolonepropionase-like amidohydrolase